ncbi:hypothetical protein [Paenibacillus sp. BC26]|uniref:hypothetical protein n=1 Tax=Paenibacillus sp. BC26 TaxID=1881032 RepID=UPI001160995B|nr:hypothetical protein [Paenibacillus sp. BC26]
MIWQAVDAAVGNGWSKEVGVHQELDASMVSFLRDRSGLISYGTIFGDSSLRKKIKNDVYTDIVQPIESEEN